VNTLYGDRTRQYEYFYEDEMLANGHDLGQRSKIAIYTITWNKNHIKFLSATRRPKLCRNIIDKMVHIVK
jgi:hypothetical protein